MKRELRPCNENFVNVYDQRLIKILLLYCYCKKQRSQPVSIINTHCGFPFDLIFLKNQNISSTFLLKTNTSSCSSASENLPFSYTTH